MIRINEDFETFRDQYCWHLVHWTNTTHPKAKNKRTSRTTYHATLEQVCAAVIDRSAGELEDLKSIIELLKDAPKALAENVSK